MLPTLEDSLGESGQAPALAKARAGLPAWLAVLGLNNQSPPGGRVQEQQL